MQTVQATYVLTVRTGLATETLCIGTVLDWQLLLVKDYITVDVCNRNLGCRDEIEVIKIAVVHLTLLVGELACTVT